MENLIVIRKYDKTPEGYIRVDVTSHNSMLRESLSPFYLGPIKSWDDIEVKKMENLWQFSKVYPCHVDENNNPTKEWWDWRNKGFVDEKPHRHPIKGRPLYNYWNGEKLDYIESRKKVYIPAYYKCITENNFGINYIQDLLKEGNKVAISDFDGFNFIKAGMSIEELIEDPTHIMGHGHVIYAIIKRPDIIEELFNNSVFK